MNRSGVPVRDETDARILNALLDDGRASLRSLGEEVGVAVTTVSNRLRDLEDAGIVQGYVPRINYAALGYDTAAVFHLWVAGDALEATAERLCDCPEMLSVYEVAADFDLVAIGRFPDTAALNARMRDLLTSEGVSRLTTSVVLDAPAEGRQFPLAVEE